jgi:predicted exporter
MIYPASAPAIPVLRWVSLWTALVLAAIAVLLLVASHTSIREKPDSDMSSLSSLKADAYRQHKPLGSAFSTPHGNPEAVLASAHVSPRLHQVP